MRGARGVGYSKRWVVEVSQQVGRFARSLESERLVRLRAYARSPQGGPRAAPRLTFRSFAIG